MRAVLIISLLLAVSGCYSIRHRNDVADGTDAKPAVAKPAREGKQPPLPAGLAGDKEHHAYTSDAPH